MLTKELINSFKLNGILFFYLPHFIIKWDPDYKTLFLTRSKRSWFVWIYGVVNAVVTASGSIYTVYTHYFVQPRPHFGLTHTFMLVTGAVAVVIFCTALSLVVWKRDDFQLGFNQIHYLDRQLTKIYRPESLNKNDDFNNDDQPDIIGIATCACIALFSATPYWIVLFTVFQGYDYGKFILDDILPDVKYRGFGTIILVNLARTVMLAPGLIEVFRSLAYALPLSVSFTNFYLACMTYLAHKIESLTEFIGVHILFDLTWRITEFAVGGSIFLDITFDYLGTVFALGFCIVGYGKLDKMMYICLVVGTGGALVISAVAFVKLKNAVIMLEDMVDSRVVMAKLRYSRIRTRTSRIIRSRMLAIRTNRIPYGPFFYLEKDFGLSYFENINEHVIDTVLMYDFR